MVKYVYDFSEGDKSMKDLLGGKGANLAEMTKLGLPVPPGFTITTEACRAYLKESTVPESLATEVTTALREVEEELGRELGAPEPLWNKVPTADLLDGTPGQTDEAELGMTYEDIDDYLEGKDVPTEVAEKLEGIWLRSRHKRTTPVTIHDDWWR